MRSRDLLQFAQPYRHGTLRAVDGIACDSVPVHLIDQDIKGVRGVATRSIQFAPAQAPFESGSCRGRRVARNKTLCQALSIGPCARASGVT